MKHYRVYIKGYRNLYYVVSAPTKASAVAKLINVKKSEIEKIVPASSEDFRTKENPRYKRYRVRKNFKKYGKRSKASRRRSRRGKR